MKKKNTVLNIDGVAKELFQEVDGSETGPLSSLWNTATEYGGKAVDVAKPYWNKATDTVSSFFTTTPTDGTFWSKSSSTPQNLSDGINQAKDFAKESIKDITKPAPADLVGNVIKTAASTEEKIPEEVKTNGDAGSVVQHVERQIAHMPMWQKGALGGAAVGIPLALIAMHMYNKNKAKKNQQSEYYQNPQYPYNY